MSCSPNYVKQNVVLFLCISTISTGYSSLKNVFVFVFVLQCLFQMLCSDLSAGCPLFRFPGRCTLLSLAVLSVMCRYPRSRIVFYRESYRIACLDTNCPLCYGPRRTYSCIQQRRRRSGLSLVPPVGCGVGGMRGTLCRPTRRPLGRPCLRRRSRLAGSRQPLKTESGRVPDRWSATPTRRAGAPTVTTGWCRTPPALRRRPGSSGTAVGSE